MNYNFHQHTFGLPYPDSEKTKPIGHLFADGFEDEEAAPWPYLENGEINPKYGQFLKGLNS